MKFMLLFFPIKYCYSDITLPKNINFISSVDRNFNRAKATCYTCLRHNAAFSYIILRLTYIQGLILESGQDFPTADYSDVCEHLSIYIAFLKMFYQTFSITCIRICSIQSSYYTQRQKLSTTNYVAFFFQSNVM